MSILVTGGAGYIGGHMSLALADRGEPFVVLDDLSNGLPWAVPKGVSLEVGDVRDYERVRRIIDDYRINTIIHFAATLIMPSMEDRPLDYYRINVSGSRALLQAAADAEVENFIYSGSSSVYGNPPHNPVSEDAPLRPTTPYGKSKLITELMLEDIGSVTALRYVCLRYFNVAGADPKARYGQSTSRTTLLVQRVVQCALGILPSIEVFGTDYPTPDGTCIRDYLHVADLVDAHLLALDYLRSGGASRTFNVGYGHGYSVREIIETVRKVTGRNFAVTESGRRRGDPIEVVAEAQRIGEELGWNPQRDDIELIVRHAARWEEALQERAAAGNW